MYTHYVATSLTLPFNSVYTRIYTFYAAFLIGRITRLDRSSVRPSVPYGLVSRKHGVDKTEIIVNIPLVPCNRCANFQLKGQNQGHQTRQEMTHISCKCREPTRNNLQSRAAWSVTAEF